jgi:hypothetical protein
MKDGRTCPSVQVDPHFIEDAIIREEKCKEERGRSDETSSPTNTVSSVLPSSGGSCDFVKVTVYRRLTFKRAEDFDSIQGGIEFSAPKSDAVQAVKRELESLRRVLEEEKRDTIAGTKPTSTQKPETPDPYDSLPWHPSRKDRNLSMIRVDEKLSPPGKELYQKLRAEDTRTLRIGDRCYKLWLTADGAEFLQKWSRPLGGR